MAGGTKAWRAIEAIATHLRAVGGEGTAEVLRRLGEQDLSESAAQAVNSTDKPATRFVAEVLRNAKPHCEEIAKALADIWQSLAWRQSPANIAVLGEGFQQNYAWAELIGPTGFFPGDDFRLGFLLLGPHQHYIDHWHPAPELYLPMTAGSFWKKGDSGFIERDAGHVIWHPSRTIHATKTFAAPLLAAYCWTQDVVTPASFQV